MSRLHYPIRTLGPGSRVGIWVQGCSIQCAGCISADTWTAGRGMTTVDDVMKTVSPWLSVADGVTVSGGEPFDQPEALRELLLRIRAASEGDIFVFSGYPYEAIAHRLEESFDGLIDAVMTDPYQAETPQTLALRGSDNQRLFCLTPKGEAAFRRFDRRLTTADRQLDVFVQDDGTVWMVGIPRRGDLQRLTAQLAADGHSATTTEAPRGEGVRDDD